MLSAGIARIPTTLPLSSYISTGILPSASTSPTTVTFASTPSIAATPVVPIGIVIGSISFSSFFVACSIACASLAAFSSSASRALVMWAISSMPTICTLPSMPFTMNLLALAVLSISPSSSITTSPVLMVTGVPPVSSASYTLPSSCWIASTLLRASSPACCILCSASCIIPSRLARAVKYTLSISSLSACSAMYEVGSSTSSSSLTSSSVSPSSVIVFWYSCSIARFSVPTASIPCV